MAASSLLLLPALLAAALFAVAISSDPATAVPIRCRSGWTPALQAVPPSRIDDGYCDCPLDGLDEPSTGACSGAMDGMWAGIPPRHGSGDLDAARPSALDGAHFACPEQPHLKLPLGRVGDGICDCCDGADEASSSPRANCGDVCDEVLAEERAARAKARSNYEIGSKRRRDYAAQYAKWRDEKTADVERLREVDLLKAEKDLVELEESLVAAKVALARDWLRGVNVETLGKKPLKDLLGVGSGMDTEDLASFVLSLCALSAELAADNVANGRCVAFDRASLDVGILWDYANDDEEGDVLPRFEYLDPGTDEALLVYAEKIMLRLEGKDTDPLPRSRENKNKKQHKKEKPEPEPEPEDYYDSEDDPYGDDWEDRMEDYHDSEDDYEDHVFKEKEDPPEDGDEDEAEKDEPEPTANEVLVKSLLDRVPFDRTPFKEQSKLLLEFTLGTMDDEDVTLEEEKDAEELLSEDADELPAVATDVKIAEVDPMALQMTKSAISRRLSNISQGESAARSTARFVAALAEQGTEAPGDKMRNLAVLMLYHAGLAAGDVAELVYATSGHFRVTSKERFGDEATCSQMSMCPPRTVPVEDAAYPPSVIVEAARRRCEEREDAVGACAIVQEEGDVEFPTTLPDGYYNYYEPRTREGSGDDELTPHFSGMASLHAEMPPDLTALIKQKGATEKKKKSLAKRVSELENELGDKSKFGPDGELYLLRDTCHKVQSGKYEYELCVFGKATQRDAGQSSGGTNLGSWGAPDVDENGQRTLKWTGGTKCWNGPARSAEVAVTCSAETRLLTADEPETCRYVFTMESPIGCDEQFKQRNSL